LLLPPALSHPLLALLALPASGDVVSFLVYAGAYLVKEEERMSGNVV
jgi:hypothetical protein